MVTPRPDVPRHATGAASRSGFLLTAVGVFFLTLAWRVMTFSGFANDQYVHLARARQMLLGEWPVRDFVDPGMPLMYLASAAAWWMWGGAIGTELWLTAAAFALGAVCTFHVAWRLSGSMAVAAFVSVLEILISPRAYSYPKVLLYAVAAWGILALVERPSRRRVLALSGLAAVAFLFRHDHGLYIGVASATAVGLAFAPLGPRVVAGRLTLLIAAAGVLVLPWLGWIEHYQGLFPYFRSGIEFSRAEAAASAFTEWPRVVMRPRDGLVRVRPPARPVATIEWRDTVSDAERAALERRHRLEPTGDPSPPWRYYVHDRAPEALRALADAPGVADTSGLGRVAEWSAWREVLARASPARLEAGPGLHGRDNAYVWLFYLFRLLPALCLVLLWRRHARGLERWPGETRALAALCVMAVLVDFGLLRGNLPVWLPDAIVPAALLLAWLVPLAWRAGERGAVRLTARALLTAGLAVTAAAVLSAGDVPEGLEKSGLDSGMTAVWARARDLGTRLRRSHREAGFPPSTVSSGLEQVFAFLSRCTTNQDRLLMTHLFPDVFVMAERGFAGGQIGFVDGYYTSTVEQELTLARMERERVPFVLRFLDREPEFRNGFALVNDYIERRYRAIADVPVDGTRGVRLLATRAREAPRVDAETQWPCFVDGESP